MSYVSSGTPLGTLCVGANWPEASGTKTSESRQEKMLAFDILKRIIVKSYRKQTTAVKAKKRRQSTTRIDAVVAISLSFAKRDGC